MPYEISIGILNSEIVPVLEPGENLDTRFPGFMVCHIGGGWGDAIELFTVLCATNYRLLFACNYPVSQRILSCSYNDIAAIYIDNGFFSKKIVLRTPNGNQRKFDKPIFYPYDSDLLAASHLWPTSEEFVEFVQSQVAKKYQSNP